MTREEQIEIITQNNIDDISSICSPTDEYIKGYTHGFKEGAEWADNHPNWHDVDEELPPIDTAITYKFSKKVLVSDGEHIHVSRYNYNTGEWFVIDITVTYWMYLPEFLKED